MERGPVVKIFFFLLPSPSTLQLIYICAQTYKNVIPRVVISSFSEEVPPNPFSFQSPLRTLLHIYILSTTLTFAFQFTNMLKPTSV